MIELSDYERWKQDQAQRAAAGANVVLGSIDTPPDEVAGDWNLADSWAKETGKPVPPLPLVTEYRSVFQSQIEERRNATILSSSPMLADWLRKPENAALAKDDLEGLSWFETTMGAAGNSIKRGITRIPQATNQMLAFGAAERLADESRSFGDILTDRTTIRGRDGEALGNKILPGPDDLYFAGTRYLQSRILPLLGMDAEQAAVGYQQAAGEIAQRIAATPMSPAGSRYRDVFAGLEPTDSLGADFSQFVTSVADDPAGFLAFLSEVAAESIPVLGATAVVAGATRNPTAAAAFMGTMSGATEAGVSPMEFFQEKGVDVSTPDGALAAVTDVDLMRDAQQRGLLRGVVIGALDGLSGGLAGQQLAKSAIGNAVLQSVAQAFLGGLGEAGAQVTAGQEFNLNEVIIEALAEFVTAPIEVASVGAGQFVRGQRKAREAEDRQSLLQELSDQAVNSKLRARVPGAFRDFVERATEGKPGQTLYVPADKFTEYFQNMGLDPFTVIEGLDGVTADGLRDALATGGDLQIPTATYAAAIAGSEHDAFLMENMRFDPDEFTSAEARAFNERATEALEEAYAEADRMRAEDERFKSFEAEIYDTMVERLRMAGRSTDVATNEAMLYPAFYRTMAERSGLTIEEFMQRYPLPQVRGELPQGVQSRDVDDLTRTLAEARNFRGTSQAARTPLLEFISNYGGIADRGGELAARDAVEIRRGRGRSTLRLGRDVSGDGQATMFGSDGTGRAYGPDDVAQAAIEAGLMADNPVVQEYQAAMREGRQVPDITLALWDEIDNEMRGQASMTADDMNADVSADDRIQALEEYLAQIGVSLDDSDAEIRAAIEADQAERGRMYGQPAPLVFQRKRGSIQFPAAGVGNGDTVISLFRSADLSTLMHESGHYFLTVMQDMAQRGEPGATEEFQSVKDWWRSNASDVARDAMRVMPDVTVTEQDVITALDEGTTGDVLKDAAIDVGMQEQFARGFEAYLMEGKAPSQALRGAFEKFRAWLVSVYRSLRGLNVEISPEISAVFDRMLATDQEIATANEASGAGSIFASAEDMGLSADDYAAFQRLAQQAEDEASQKLLAETMAPIQRETEKWFKDERATVRAEVEREVNAQRHYRAWEWMGNRRWLGDGKPEALGDFRMSKDMLVERYGTGVLKTLPRGKQTIYAVEGGIDPDVAADLFGFSSGDEMIRALERAAPRKEAIEAETDRVMFERHGDPLADGAVQQMALDAVHGDKRARTLAVELKALTDVAGSDRGITHKEAREIARQTLSRTKVRDAMAANRYLTAERKAGEEAQRLAATVTRTGMWMDAARRKVGVQARAGVREGDTAAPARVAGQVDRANTSTQRYNENVQKLIEAKRRQLLNHAMYSEARRIAAEVESAERLVARLQKKSTRDKLAGDYLEAIDELLQRYDFRKLSGRAEDRRGALLAYVERMTAEGRENELAIPDRVLQDAQRTPYKKITVEHLRGVVDSLKNIEHTARLKRTLQDAQSQRELDAVVEDIVGAFDANLPKRPPARVGDNAEGRRNSVRRFLDLVLNATTLLREIDGFEDMGPAYRNIKGPIDAAMNRLQGRRQKAATDLDALYEVYTKQERRAMAVREFVPEVDASLSKWERIAVALNMGNEGNYQRLTDTKVRGGFSEAQVAAIVSTLDARDAAFVQSVWNYLETFRPDIEAREKRATGVAPKWVEARPVEIAGQTLTGGYYPLRYDARLSSLARDDQAQDISKSLQAGRFGKAQTRNGHLKERAQSSGRAVELDIGVLHQHVQQVVYDIELSEPVNNSWRILQDSRIRDAFTETGKQPDFDALEIWLKDVAEGEIRSSDAVGKLSRRFKSNFTAAKLAFNLSTVAIQITGVAQSMVVVGKKDFLGGVVASMRPGVEADIIAKSQFMRDRQTTFNKDIFDLYNDPKMGPTVGRWTELRNEWIAPLGLWLMTKVQFYSVDMPSWLAGYEQGLRKFGTEDQAIAYADDVVKRAQASGLFSDRSAIERGSTSMAARQNDFIRLFTTLGSYMFAKFNVAYERSARAGQTIRSEGASLASVREAFSWSIDMAFLFTLEAVLYAAIKGRLPDEDDEEDDWTTFLARETALSIASTIPFVRDLGGVYSGFSGGGAYGAMTEEMTRPFQQAAQGELDRPFVKSIINATGLFTGLPTGQINRAVDAGWRAAEGEDVSPFEYILGRMGN